MSAVQASSSPEIVLRAEKITRVFPGTVALEDVDFEVYDSSVNVLIGENGAGKSTLMRILAGVDQPTSGRIVMGGDVVSFSSVLDAASKGIGIVFQELNLCPNLSVTENIFLGRDITRAGLHIDMPRQRQRARELLARLEHDIDPDTLVGDLRIGEQQIVEIAKALVDDVRVLILDEPTSALSASEVEVLFQVIAELKQAGVAIIYISHRLEELMRIGDYITVLRDGRRVGHRTRGEASIGWIIDQMLGDKARRRDARAPAKVGEVVLEARGLSVPRPGGGFLLEDVNARFRAGEVTALYGLLGSGRTECLEALFGARAASGQVILQGQDISRLALWRRCRQRIRFVPEDRQRDGLFHNLGVDGNLLTSHLGALSRGGVLSSGGMKDHVAAMMRRLGVKAPSPQAPVGALSGGNQQKVVIGRGLMTDPLVMLLDEPSRGVDIGARGEVFETMRELASQGMAVVFATSDLLEARAVADRVLVLSGGRLTADLTLEEASEAALVAASNGASIPSQSMELAG
jgi:erythritol transport system ATP-binding protein